jgi:hypothetical protein
MHSSICRLFGKTLSDSGTLSFNFSEAFVTALFDLTFVPTILSSSTQSATSLCEHQKPPN